MKIFFREPGVVLVPMILLMGMSMDPCVGQLRLPRAFHRKLFGFSFGGFGPGSLFGSPAPTSAPPTSPSPTAQPTTSANTPSPTAQPTTSPTEQPSTSLPTPAPTPVSTFYLNPVYNSGNQTHPNQTSIGTFKWLVVESNTGSYDGSLQDPPEGCRSTDTGYPTACDWPSIRSIKATAPIYSSGDSNEWNLATALEIPDSDKSYMVTVMAKGYRLCGGYFKAGPHTESVTVDVVCQEHPLPLGTIRMFIFEDTQRKYPHA